MDRLCGVRHGESVSNQVPVSIYVQQCGNFIYASMLLLTTLCCYGQCYEEGVRHGESVSYKVPVSIDVQQCGNFICSSMFLAIDHAILLWSVL